MAGCELGFLDVLATLREVARGTRVFILLRSQGPASATCAISYPDDELASSKAASSFTQSSPFHVQLDVCLHPLCFCLPLF